MRAVDGKQEINLKWPNNKTCSARDLQKLPTAINTEVSRESIQLATNSGVIVAIYRYETFN